VRDQTVIEELMKKEAGLKKFKKKENNKFNMQLEEKRKDWEECSKEVEETNDEEDSGAEEDDFDI
jgi:hypothetical protein